MKSMKLHERSRFPITLLAGTVVVLALLGVLYLLVRLTESAAPGAEQHLPMSTVEQTYAGHVHFQNLRMSRAANFLNQEVTYLAGELSNDGARIIRDMEVAVEYRDSLNQVVLRETKRPLGSPSLPLPAGQRRAFQLGFEHIPDDWNHQYPTIRVTGLLLE